MNAIRGGNQSSVKYYANAINSDSSNVSNALSGTLGWVNSAQYEYQLLKSEAAGGTGYLYARAVMPTATNAYNAAMLAYNEAEGYFASASSLPSSGSGIWGLVCLGIAVFGVSGAVESFGLSEAATASIEWILSRTGLACAIVSA